MTESPTDDPIVIAERDGATFTFNRDRGWYWGYQGHPSLLNGPCETQEEAALEFIEATKPEPDEETAPTGPST